MNLSELQNSYQVAIWKEILPDVLVGFGVIIPLLLAGAWTANRKEGSPQQAGFRFDFIAALALCAWLGFFFGQRLVFLMERPDKWAIGTLLGTAVCTFALLLTNRGEPNTLHQSDQDGPLLSEANAVKPSREKLTKFLEKRPRLKYTLHYLRHRAIPGISRITKNSAPVIIRGVAVFCLASSTATYSFLVSRTKVVITVKKPSDRTEWPTFGTCFLGRTGSSGGDEGKSLSGQTLPYRITNLNTDSRKITLWLEGLAAEKIGAPNWKISMALPNPSDSASVNPIDVAMDSLASEAQGLLNVEVYRIEKTLP